MMVGIFEPARSYLPIKYTKYAKVKETILIFSGMGEIRSPSPTINALHTGALSEGISWVRPPIANDESDETVE